MNDEPEQSACREIAAYWKRRKENPKLLFADPSASWKRTNTCGCGLCTVILAVLRGEDGKETTMEDGDKDRQVKVKFSPSGTMLKMGEKEREIFTLHPHELDQIPTSTSVTGSTASEQSFETAMRWLKTCLTTHKMLCPGLTVNQLPSRVIDTTPSSSQPSCVKLIQVSQERGHYISLSHCWGPRKHQPLRTTLNPDTFSQYKAGINVEDMPKTFRDAVEFTRKIGAQYLWIDSLCIIQDSTEDWEIESAQMGSIYRNSLITLAASAAPDGRHGLYVSTDEKYIDRPLSSLTGQEDESIRFRTPLPHESAEHPLMNRAWVFQERLLSPRVLHFGRHELVWECGEDMACECSGFSMKVYDSRDKWLEPKAYLRPESLAGLPQTQVVDIWHKAVTSFSMLGLSVEADILPAISGIAKMVKEARNGKYLAGLWKESFAWDLCWITSEPANARRPERWRAPSFSWASVVAAVDYTELGSFKTGMKWNPLFEHIKDIKGRCSLAGVDETGAVKDGFVLLSGTLIQAAVTYNQLSGKWDVVLVGKQIHPISFSRDYQYDVDGPHRVESGQIVYLLKVLSMERKTTERDDQWAVYLVLRKTEMREDGDNGVYERIGLCKHVGDRGDRLEAVSERAAVFADVEIRII